MKAKPIMDTSPEKMHTSNEGKPPTQSFAARAPYSSSRKAGKTATANNKCEPLCSLTSSIGITRAPPTVPLPVLRPAPGRVIDTSNSFTCVIHRRSKSVMHPSSSKPTHQTPHTLQQWLTTFRAQIQTSAASVSTKQEIPVKRVTDQLWLNVSLEKKWSSRNSPFLDLCLLYHKVETEQTTK